ncbi:hypothetical protein HKX48_005449 [Thoreauomyces humboldtii]|nr:hypothetical protein HKX48_005449 [Thoreauomyces humboldtii]
MAEHVKAILDSGLKAFVDLVLLASYHARITGVAKYEIDHISYRVASPTDYRRRKRELADVAVLLAEGEVGGGLVATYKLLPEHALSMKTVVADRGNMVIRMVDVVELAAPKFGSDHPTGLMHVRILGYDMPLEEFGAMHSAVQPNCFEIRKDTSADLRIDFRHGDNLVGGRGFSLRFQGSTVAMETEENETGDRRVRSWDTLIVDYDCTLSLEDTIHLIPEAAGVKNPSQSWKDVTDAYAEDYAAHVPPTDTGLEGWLESFAEVEARSICRVNNSGCLAGLRRADLRRVGLQVEFRPGAQQCLLRWKGALSVCSVNWSRDLIAARLPSSASILSNDLEFSPDHSEEVSTGRVLGCMRVASDKLRAAREAVRSLDECIYVGDSSTDLLLLTQAGLGILVAPSESVSALCAKFGVKTAPLEQARGSLKEKGCVYIAEKGWESIICFLEFTEFLKER